MQRKLLVGLPLALAALAAGIWLAQTHYAPKSPAAAAVSGLWQLNFPDSQGHKQPLSQWRGQVLVVNFWASWCAPCREEIPDFVALRAKYRPNGVEFVGIAIDSAENTSKFTQRFQVNYPILIGEGAGHGLARQLGDSSGALPYTIVLDRNGTI